MSLRADASVFLNFPLGIPPQPTIQSCRRLGRRHIAFVLWPACGEGAMRVSKIEDERECELSVDVFGLETSLAPQIDLRPVGDEEVPGCRADILPSIGLSLGSAQRSS